LGNHINRTEKEGESLFRYAFQHRGTTKKKEEEKIEIAERVLLFLISRPERQLVCVCVNSILSSCLYLFFLTVRVA
jgi:hypothetical protein